MPDPASSANWTPVARLLRPQGRRGEILAEPLTDREGVFLAGQAIRFPREERLLDTTPTATLEDAWRPQGRNAGRIVVKLSGVDSISAAEALQGRQLFIQADTLPPLEAGTYLVQDLLGCALFNGDTAVGVVTDVQFPIAADGHTRLADAPDLLLVTPESSAASHVDGETPADVSPEPFLVPFVQAWLQGVDLAARCIYMTLPEGLLHRDDEQAAGGL